MAEEHEHEQEADPSSSSSSSHVEAGNLTERDLGELLHRVSLPSVASPTVPRNFGAGSTRNSAVESDPGVRNRPVLTGSRSASVLSNTSEDREREEDSSSGTGTGKKRLLPSQQEKKRQRQTRLHRSLPPPRTSSRQRERFVGFESVVGGNSKMSMENLHEVSSRAPVRRESFSPELAQSLFVPESDLGNVPEISIPEPEDPLHRHITTSTSRRQSVVSQVRDLANQQRRSRFSEVDVTKSSSAGKFGTPRTYRDDTDDTLGSAAPAPSISPISHRRSRLEEGSIAIPPPVGRSVSRLETEKTPILSGAATQFYIYSYLIFFSIFGTLARLGLKALTFYPGAPADTPVLWANFAGTFALGFLLEDRNLFVEGWVEDDDFTMANGVPTAESLEKARFERIQRVKKTIPLYIGLATGFCGSLTSFSSFVLDAFLAMSNNLPTPINHPYPDDVEIPDTGTTIPRSAGYGVMALLAVIILNVTVPLAALKLGAHLALSLDGLVPALPFRFCRTVMDRVIVFLAWGCWIGAIIMCVWPPDRPGGPATSSNSWMTEYWRGDAIIAIVLAPVGCIMRFQLALRFNGVSASFPLGTFAANVFATAVLGMAYDLQRSNLGQGTSVGVGGGLVGCEVLKGIEDGFCGALSTVSTWVGEMIALGEGSGVTMDAFGGFSKRMSLGRGYVYGLGTIVAGVCIMVVVMGSVAWGIGWEQSVC